MDETTKVTFTMEESACYPDSFHVFEGPHRNDDVWIGHINQAGPRGKLAKGQAVIVEMEIWFENHPLGRDVLNLEEPYLVGLFREGSELPALRQPLIESPAP